MNQIKDGAEIVKGIVEAVPIYEDLLRPAVSEIGKVAGGTVRLALSPLAGIIWGFDRVVEWAEVEVASILKKKEIPEERISTPALLIAGPTLDAMRFAGSESSLRQMYAHLLATAMDSDTAHLAHPAFVEIIKQLNPDEARLLSWLAHGVQEIGDFVVKETASKFLNRISDWAGCSHHSSILSYFDNLTRLGLISFPFYRLANYAGGDLCIFRFCSKDKQPNRITFSRIALDAEKETVAIAITAYGDQFAEACM